jgi:hypothetical protein
MSGVDGVLLLSTAAFIVVGLAVGARVLLLSRRTRGFPERMLGLSVLAGQGLVAPSVIVVHAVTEPELLVRIAGAVAPVAYAAFAGFLMAFTRDCFRPNEAWAAWFFRASIATVSAAAAVGVARALGLATPAELKDMGHWTFTTISLASFVGHAWTGAEAFSYYARMRKRRAIGLADPIVTNRFLLWGLIAAAAMVATGLPLAVTLAGGESYTNVAVRLTGAAATVFGTVCLDLAFLPPQFYVRWLSASHPR